MRNFLIGLAGLVGGAILWVAASAVGGAIEGLGGERDPVLYSLMFLGWLVMICMPMAFWVVIPLARRLRR